MRRGVLRLFSPLLVRWGFLARVIARRGWWPTPDDLSRMNNRDFRAFTRSIGLDERVEVALTESHEGTRQAQADASLSRSEGRP